MESSKNRRKHRAKKDKTTENRDDSSQATPVVEESSAGVIRRITLTATPEGLNIEDALDAFGIDDKEAREGLATLLSAEDQVMDWLAANPENIESFKSDPLEVLKKQFPGLKFPEPRLVPAERPEVELAFSKGNPAALDLLRRVQAFVFASESNTNAFKTNHAQVIASVGAGDPASIVAAVVEAFDQVRQVYQLAPALPVMEMLEHVPRGIRSEFDIP